jgi:3-hydroxyacyl-CoA dehydrogenase
MSDLVQVQRDGGDVGIVTIANPPVNALSPTVLEGIQTGVQSLVQDPAIRAIVLTGAGRIFSGGADIHEFQKITSGEKERGGGFLAFLKQIEDGSKPVICAMHGTAFGGGLELAQACHYRVAAPATQVGQPEVKLGIIPGAGGTQRLPRLAGVAKATDMCVVGNPIPAADALACGILDRIIEGDLVQGAVAFAREMVAKGGPPRKTCDLKDKIGDKEANAKVFAAAREAARKRTPYLLAPFKAIDAVEAATQMPFDKGIFREAELFRECLLSEQSRALVHVFFAEREVSKVPDLPRNTPSIPIKRAAVVGAGTMGGGITMNYANAGIPVLLKEASQELLDRGLAIIRKNYAATVQKGRLTQKQMDERMALIQPTLDYDRFKEADIVVEAVFEEMALKKKVFAELDKVARPDAILASNTSTLDIDAIASATGRPRQVIGHHFFSPANVMKLLEIVRGKQSAPEVITTSLALARTLAKVGVLVGNCKGFVGNRLFEYYHNEAQFLVEEGAKPEEVDAALAGFGMAMGPLAVVDLAGLDVGWRIRKEYKHLVRPGQRVPLVEDRLCEMGRYGQKTGAGWYRYPEGSRTPVPEPEVEKLIEETAKSAGIKRRKITPQEMVERTVYALINEGAKVLEEGLALRASDIDIIYIYGYGFPAYRGGPMWFGDREGLDRVYERVRQFEKDHGESWKPAPLLKQLAEGRRTFAEYDKAKAAVP